MQLLVLVFFEGKPQADVGVPCGTRRDGVGNRQEEGLRAGLRMESCLDPQFFQDFTTHRVCGVFIRLDVSASGQPHARQAVVAQQHATGGAIHDEKIGHQVR